MAYQQIIVSESYPYLPIRISMRGWEQETLALMDTGFTGDLIIPEDSVPYSVGSSDGYIDFRVADDRITSSPLYFADFEIVGLPMIPEVSVGELGSAYIIGRKIIDRYRITLDYGQRIIVEV